MSKTCKGTLVAVLALAALALPGTWAIGGQPEWPWTLGAQAPFGLVALGQPGPAGSAEGSAESLDPIPPELEDPDFNRFIDWRELGRAYSTLDPARLTDLAVKLEAAEKALHRVHKVISSSRLFTDAVEAAVDQGDPAALGRLEMIAQGWGVPDLQAKAAAARPGAVLSRGVASRSLVPEGTSKDVASLIRAFHARISSAAVLKDRDALEECEQRIAMSDQLPEYARDALLKKVAQALKGTPETTDDPFDPLRQLTVASRALTKADYLAGRTSWLSPNGFFQEIDPKVWVERRNPSRQRLRETTRNRLYVELYDPSLKRRVRLLSMRAYERRDGEAWRVLGRGHWEDPALVPLDDMKLPDIRGQVERGARRSFPHLGKRFEVLGPATRRYNCIAWSLNVTSDWIWPGDQVRDFDRLNGQRGYQRINGLDFVRVRGTDRIVLYGKRSRGRLVATHQARQLADGSWSSKLGALPLIRHIQPEDLNGDVYGLPIAVYARQRQSGDRSLSQE
jgi:hypothetical protein